MKALNIYSCIIAAAAAVSTGAVTFTLTSPETLGYIAPGTETSTEANAAYINSLIDRNNNNSSSSTFDRAGQIYVLINDTGTTLALADAAGVVDTGAVGGDDEVTVTGYEYLIVKYGGANGSALVFNVTGITGDVILPETDLTGGNANKYLLFNSAGATNVPDGGTTVALLGAGLIGLAAARRKFGSL
jgi:hypothetical protein